MSSKLLGLLRPLLAKSLRTTGDIRTRKTGSGGGDLFVRHVNLGPAGFVYFNDPGVGTADGAPYARLGASGAPSQDFTIQVGGYDAVVVDNDSDIGRTDIKKLTRYTAFTLPFGVPGGSVAIPTGENARAIVSGNWDCTDWYLAIDAAGGPFRVELLKISNASYAGTVATTSVTGTANATGGCPRIALGSVKNNGGGNISSWPAPTLDEGDIVSGNVLVNSAGAKWAFLLVIGTKREEA